MLISYLAPVVNPATLWPVAFFGLAYPPMLLIAIILMVYWLLRKPVYMLLSLGTILIGYNVLLNNVGFRFSGSNAVSPNAIKIITYNVHSFKPFGQDNDANTRHSILDMLTTQDADVIVFQEFLSRKRGQYALVDSMVKLMKSSHYYFKPIHSSETEDIGMAIFSKFPVERTGVITLTGGRSDNQCIFADFKRENKTFRVYNVHLQSVQFDSEDYRYLDTVSKKGKPSVGASKRLGGKLKNAFIKRSQQVFKVKEDAAACKYPYVIAGDFNDTPTSFAVNRMAYGLKNAFREKGSGLGRTYNGSFPNYQIDYVMASPQFDVAAYRVVEKKLSDHYPLYCELVLN